jgi:hypothetical protein
MNEKVKKIALDLGLDKQKDLSFHVERAEDKLPQPAFIRCEHVGPHGNRGIDSWWNHMLKMEEGKFLALQFCQECSELAIAMPEYLGKYLYYRIRTVCVSRGNEIHHRQRPGIRCLQPAGRQVVPGSPGRIEKKRGVN